MAIGANSLVSGQDEPGIGLGPVVVASIGLSLVLGAAVTVLGETSYRERAHVLASLLSLVAGCAWLLEQWRPRAARWFFVMSWVGLSHIAWHTLPAAGLWALTALSPVLALALLGPWEALAIAAAQSCWVVVAQQFSSSASKVDGGAMALGMTWAFSGVAYALYHHLSTGNATLLGHYERAVLAREAAEAEHLRLQQGASALEKASRQMLAANERIGALRTIAEEAEQTKALFVARVSHEFRTPLNMIVGLAELMLETPEVYAVALPPTMRHDLEVIVRNCRHLSAMVDDVLDLTRVETGRVRLAKERVNLAKLIDSAVVAVSPLIDKKGLEVVQSVDGDLPLVHCDRARIRQVVLNLISNAARYTDTGSVTISASVAGGNVQVSVRDTGPGIAPQDLERIFEPFAQASTPATGHQSGSGLGLSISQQFIHLHQGRMWVESAVGSGSTFSFELPVSAPVQPTSRPSRWIREDWIWQADAFRASAAGQAARSRKTRVAIYDASGGLLPGIPILERDRGRASGSAQ